MKRAIALLTAACAFAAVDGTVVNQTTGKPQPNAVVTLFKLTQSGPQYVQAAKSDPQGKFTIAQETGPGPLLVETGFEGVSYNQMLPPGMPRTSVTLNVFDSTKDAAAAQIEQHIVILEPAAAQLGVTETYFFKNEGKVTYDDPGNGTLRFFVAAAGKGTVKVMATSPGSMSVQRQPEAAKAAGVYKLDFPIKPGGETRIDISYVLPAAGTFSGKVFYKGAPTRLVVPNGVTLEGSGLTSLGSEPQTQAAIYETAAAAFEVKIAGEGSIRSPEPAAEEADDSGPSLRTIPPPGFEDRRLQILALMFVVLALGFVLLYRKGRTAAPVRSSK
jgi:hypothetical protein